MSDFIECPYCGEEIKTGAIKCKHCHSALDDIIKPIINDTDKDSFASKPLSVVSMGDVENNELDKLQNGDEEKIESPKMYQLLGTGFLFLAG